MRPAHTAPLFALLSVIVVLSLQLVAPRVGWAQQDVDAKVNELEVEAATAYKNGEYKSAIQLMIKANQLRPHPNYLLNIAVSYSKIGDCENAKLWGQNAIDSSNPSLPPEAKDTAREVIASCTDKDTKVEGGDKGEGDDKGQGDDKGEGDDKGDGGGDEQPDTGEPTPWLRYTGYGLAGLGGVAIVGSLVGDLGIGDDIDELEKLRNAGDTVAADRLQSDIEGSQSLVTAGYVIGFLAAAGGGTLIYLDYAGYFAEPGQTASSNRFELAPLVSPDTVGFSFGGTF